MGIAISPIGEQPWVLADWVELKALSSEFSTFNLYEMIRLNDENQETENEDFALQDNENEQCLEKVIHEIVTRIESLKGSYPFKLSNDQTELILEIDSNNKVGQFTYLFCLFFTHAIRTEVIAVDLPRDNADRDLMQVCATLAAAADQHHSISFGFPRPDKSGFLAALKDTYELMGEGTVKLSAPSGASTNPKDCGIDIISWSSTPDGTPGRKYLLGQVASGDNWREKSVKPAIDLFHKIWFDDEPPSSPQAAMFIPHCIDAKSHLDRTDKMRVLVYEFGEVFYRYRLPLAAQQGYDNAVQNSERHVDRVDDFDSVIEYVLNVLRTIFPSADITSLNVN